MYVWTKLLASNLYINVNRAMSRLYYYILHRLLFLTCS